MTSRDQSAEAQRDTVVGLFEDRSDAEQAITDLKQAGFSENDIGVAMRDRTAQGQLMEETGTQAAEGATAGVVSGGVIGGLVGALIGAGALAIPGIGPVLAGGALASAFGVTGGTALAGAGIGAASGGILGGLIGLGIPEEEARHFERGFKSGGILVTVRAAGRHAEALDILRSRNADLGPTFAGTATDRMATDTATADWTTAGGAITGAAATAGAYDTPRAFDEDAERRLQLREEDLDLSSSHEESRLDSEGGANIRARDDRVRRERFGGTERRSRNDPSYAGPERRLAVA